MAAIFDIITVVILAYAVWLLRQYVYESLEYRVARRAEIKRRLQLEHKQEQALDAALRVADDKEAVELYLKFADERSRRQIAYVVQDVFDKTK